MIELETTPAPRIEETEGEGNLSSFEVNPLAASQNGAARNQGVQGTGQAPVIRYFQLQMLLDNEAGTVTEWSKDGIGRVRPAS